MEKRERSKATVYSNEKQNNVKWIFIQLLGFDCITVCHTSHCSDKILVISKFSICIRLYTEIDAKS